MDKTNDITVEDKIRALQQRAATEAEAEAEADENVTENENVTSFRRPSRTVEYRPPNAHTITPSGAVEAYVQDRFSVVMLDDGSFFVEAFGVDFVNVLQGNQLLPAQAVSKSSAQSVREVLELFQDWASARLELYGRGGAGADLGQGVREIADEFDVSDVPRDPDDPSPKARARARTRRQR